MFDFFLERVRKKHDYSFCKNKSRGQTNSLRIRLELISSQRNGIIDLRPNNFSQRTHTDLGMAVFSSFANVFADQYWKIKGFGCHRLRMSIKIEAS